MPQVNSPPQMSVKAMTQSRSMPKITSPRTSSLTLTRLEASEQRLATNAVQHAARHVSSLPVKQSHLFQRISETARITEHENTELRARLHKARRGAAEMKQHVQELERERQRTRAGKAVPSWVVSALEAQLTTLEDESAHAQAELWRAVRAAREEKALALKEASALRERCTLLSAAIEEDLLLLPRGADDGAQTSLQLGDVPMIREVDELREDLAARRTELAARFAAEARGVAQQHGADQEMLVPLRLRVRRAVRAVPAR